MDFITLYKCIDCNTTKYLIYPYGNESLIICSACFQMRHILLEERNKHNKSVRSCCESYCNSPN
jgi:uncharacterized Zn-finger protein